MMTPTPPSQPAPLWMRLRLAAAATLAASLITGVITALTDPEGAGVLLPVAGGAMVVFGLCNLVLFLLVLPLAQARSARRGQGVRPLLQTIILMGLCLIPLVILVLLAPLPTVVSATATFAAVLVGTSGPAVYAALRPRD